METLQTFRGYNSKADLVKKDNLFIINLNGLDVSMTSNKEQAICSFNKLISQLS